MAQKVTKNNTEATTSKLVDELLSQVDPSEILSKDGLFSKLKKQLIETGLFDEDGNPNGAHNNPIDQLRI